GRLARRALKTTMILDSLGDAMGRQLKALTCAMGGPQLQVRLERAAPQLNEYGVDPFGYSTDFCLQLLGPLLWLYRRYFRVEVHGVQHVPEGPALLVANHSGQIPLDAGMISLATLLECESPRALRGMTEKWVPGL